jgi:hypothetical protein
LMTSCSHTLFSGSFVIFTSVRVMNSYDSSARRNARGHLEPDAADEKVQKSLGFGEYENAPKAEVRTT